VEEVAEAYVMGTLTEEQRTAFEDHYMMCAACAALLQKTAAYVEAMQAAARKLRSESPR
jgi:anti-sigma factor RsiW